MRSEKPNTKLGVKNHFLAFSVLFLVSYFYEFQSGQDISSVAETAEELSFLGIESSEIFQGKKAFYYFFVLPPFRVTGSMDTALLLVKWLVISIFYFYAVRKLRSKKQLYWFSGLILLAPAFIESYQEYLRQSVSLGILYLGFNAKKRAIELGLWVFACFLHPISIIVCLIALVARLGHAKRWTLHSPGVIGIALFTGIILAYSIYSGLIQLVGQSFGLQVFETVMEGRRENFLGFTVLLGYSCCLGYFFANAYKTKLAVAFYFSIISFTFYPMITDYGRALLTLSLLHLLSLVDLKWKSMVLQSVISAGFTLSLFV